MAVIAEGDKSEVPSPFIKKAGDLKTAAFNG